MLRYAMFNVNQPPTTPIPAATVILVRERAPGRDAEVFLLRRHRKSGFMSDAFVFPGGKVDPGDASAEVAAVRELFEEAGVLLARGEISGASRDAWRRRLNGGEATFADLLREERLEPDLARLHPWARWVTPSVEPKRFDARFFLVEMPPGQTPSFDQKETVEEAWLTPDEAMRRHAETGFRLPPPQLRTMWELAPHAPAGIAALRAEAARRAHTNDPIMPRFSQLGGDAIALLLPWDPEYQEKGVGEGVPWPHDAALSDDPSRFVLQGMTWRLQYPSD